MSNQNKPQPVTIETIQKLVEEMRVVSHYDAAKSQLDQAIFLWFHRDHEYVLSDPTAIHTLAVAVQGILWAYAHDSRQKPSAMAQQIYTNREHAKLKDPQNFFKHGNVGRKEKGRRKAVSHLPSLTDFFLADNIVTHNRLFKMTTPLMDMFLVRYGMRFPESGVSLETLAVKLLDAGYDSATLLGFDRKAFYELVAPHAIANIKRERVG